MNVILRGKRWCLSFVSLARERCIGKCDPPDSRRKRIRIDKSLEGQQRLEILIHEMLHACHWDMDESAVTETAHDIAKILWDIGYASQEPPAN